MTAKNKHAVALGKLGGRATSPEKSAAVRKNWLKAVEALKRKRDAKKKEKSHV
jgi:hypothetical protein